MLFRSPAGLLTALDWRLLESARGRFAAWPIRPLLQSGAIVDPKAPGLAFGAGVDAWRAIHLTGGRAWQPSIRPDGRSGGSLAPAWYVSASVSLGVLPIFRR